MKNLDKQILLNILLYVPALICAVSFHEAAHAWTANRLGDPTAGMLGRVTLNPIRHIDPIGSVLVPLFLAVSGSGFMFGWAKPVPVQLHNLSNPKRDNAFIAAAGPVSNLLLALLSAFLLRTISFAPDFLFPVLEPLMNFCAALIFVNVILAIFNIIPIPPLDGGSVLAGFLPDEAAEKYMSMRSYGMLIILLLFMIDPLNMRIWERFIAPIVSTLNRLFWAIGGLI